MDFQNFTSSLVDANPPGPISIYLQALWYEAKGNWIKSHDLVQDLPDSTAAWIHAYLHRVEGDNANARYWYSQANRVFPKVSVQEEWEAMVQELLNDHKK